MRRCLSILLLVLLPLQSTGESAGVYCQHETDAAAQHFGHHDHQHKVDPGRGGDAGLQTSGGIDNDCGSCLAGCSVAILGEVQFRPPVHVSAVADGYRHNLNPSPHYPPERPNWVRLA